MKVIIISGSPRKDGYTAKAIARFEENLISLGHEMERIFIIDYDIKGCIGCYACMAKNNEPGCIVKDDAVFIFERMISADVIVYASPLYWFDLAAQLKPFFDRQFCLTTKFGSSDASSMLAGKSVALLITCSGPVANNADLVQDIFDRSMAGILKCNVVGKYIIPFSNAPDFHDRAKDVADKMVKDIICNLSKN